MASKGSILVAAIDFGTTYSGAAISFNHEYKKDPTKIYALKIGNPLMSMKSMTCILIKPDGVTYHSFGEKAESYYYGELDASERRKWYFFKRFKMELYNAQDQQLSSFQLDGGHGKRLPVLTVFSLSIKCLKDMIIEHCSKQIGGPSIKDTEITWVLTVPAIWSDKAKAFMREAAVKAGISSEKLLIALEPEAASIYCQHIPIMRDQEDIAKLVPFQPGTKYVVLDCGGGTVDITVHEVISGGSNTGLALKEIHKARGNDMGGTKVDAAFREYLSTIVGKDVLRYYEENEEEDKWDLSNAFEEKKRHIQENGSKMTISTRLVNVFEERKEKSFNDHLDETKITDIKILAGKLRLESSVAESFFRESIDSIIRELQDIFGRADTFDCTAILLVGGYSESPLLQSRVRAAFPNKDVICPNEAGLAVLKGAVIYGHNPEAITQRISKFTYGIELNDGSFSKLVEMDQPLVVNEAQKTGTYHPQYAATAVKIIIYTSSDRNPRMVTDPGCTRIGKFSLPMPDTTGGISRTLTVKMKFGGTEFIVEAKDGNTGRIEQQRVGCWD